MSGLVFYGELRLIIFLLSFILVKLVVAFSPLIFDELVEGMVTAPFFIVRQVLLGQSVHVFFSVLSFLCHFDRLTSRQCVSLHTCIHL